MRKTITSGVLKELLFVEAGSLLLCWFFVEAAAARIEKLFRPISSQPLYKESIGNRVLGKRKNLKIGGVRKNILQQLPEGEQTNN